MWARMALLSVVLGVALGDSATVGATGEVTNDVAMLQKALDAAIAARAQAELHLAQMTQKYHAAQRAAAVLPSCDCNATTRPEDVDVKNAPNHKLKDRVEELLDAERQRQRAASFEEADQSDNGPKEISIHCPKQPNINIVDLSTTDREHNECLVLNVVAPELSSRLVLYCDGTTSGGEF